MNLKKSLSALILLLPVLFAEGQTAKSKTSPWPMLQQQMRPWTRWWWMGNAVNEKNLSAALSAYAKAGIGGVEITPIYGAKGFESRYIDYLSPQWMHMLDYTVKTAGSLGMGVDMNTGTGWPFGGPQIKPEFAASKLIVQQYKIAKGTSLKEAIVINDEKQQALNGKDGQKNAVFLQALTAYLSDGQVINLLDKVDTNGHLNWQIPNADAELYAVSCGRTMQKVKRAAPAGEGYTLDHLDKTAVNVYLKRFDDAFAGRQTGVRALFNDSYEVYGADWSPSLLQAFKQQKGYDLGKHIRELTSKDTTAAAGGRLKSDYRETMSNLLLHNFTDNWTSWAHQHQSITKNQSHGSPGNLLDLYGAVDIPETETFGSSYFPIPGLRRDSADVRNVDPDPMMSKFASSAAHVNGRTLVSSETFTWLTEHFKTAFSQAKPEAEQLFLAGVNHLFYHGTTFSPSDVPFPGWLFYASANLVSANSLWPHINGMNTYFSRCQSILQSGKSDNELLIYWPVYDQWAKPKGLDMPMKVHDIDQWLYPTAFYKQSMLLQQKGYSFDFASDLVLSHSNTANGRIRTSPAANPYQTLIIPACQYMPLATLKNILALAGKGATVIFEQLPEDVPGLSNLESNRSVFKQLLKNLNLKPSAEGMLHSRVGAGQLLVSADLPKALAFKGITGEALISSGLKFIRRKVTDGSYYYLVNHSAQAIHEWVPLRADAAAVLLLDPQSGDYGLAKVKSEGGKTWVKVALEAGETLFLKTVSPGSATAQSHSISAAQTLKPWLYTEKPGKVIQISNGWKLHFTAGGPQIPADKLLDHLGSWTLLNDTAAVNFSGRGVYSNSFTLPAHLQKEYVLNLGQVSESARVWINGADAGILWSIPFQKRVGQFLKPGKNTIRIEVANLMANRIRYMDRQGIPWRNYHEINFVNINYKPFDAAGWAPMPSGLSGPVRLTGYDQ